MEPMENCRFIMGFDDEKALIIAIKECFPGVTNAACTRHLKNNLEDHL